MRIFEVRNGDLIESLTRQIKAPWIPDAAIVTVVGIVDDFAVLTTPSDDPGTQRLHEYDKPGGIVSAVGEVRDGQVRLHASFAVDEGRVIGGHVQRATIGRHFARVYLLPTE
ncbi:PCC domain-containing protein [Kitasatospora sp. NPDC056446]|uniref:PCC domain-containing protein n=1 Tax=Kitasatospora sp. NPDC056446 TaxID=3345819 RepID=UPI0036946C84